MDALAERLRRLLDARPVAWSARAAPWQPTESVPGGNQRFSVLLDDGRRVFVKAARTHASLYFGESGILLVAWRLTRDSALADDLYARVRENVTNAKNDLVDGSPGTMPAAKAMLDWSSEERWADVWRESAEVLWSRREPDGFWVYPPYGKAPGAAHGIATNANILLAGGELFPSDRRERPPPRDRRRARAHRRRRGRARELADGGWQPARRVGRHDPAPVVPRRRRRHRLGRRLPGRGAAPRGR